MSTSSTAAQAVLTDAEVKPHPTSPESKRQAALRRIEACAPSDDELVRLAEWLEEITPKSRDNLGSQNAIRTLADVPDVYSCKAPPVSYLVEGLIPRAAVTMVSSAPGVGKTWLALALGVSCCRGVEFIGRNCEQIEVLYLDRENPLALARERVNAIAGGPVLGLHIWGNWVPDQSPMIGNPRLLAIAKAERPLIIFDSLVRFHNVEENSATEMRMAMEHLRRLADVGATVLILHHRSKSEGSKYRGSTDILAAVDMAYSLEGGDGLLQLSCYKSRFSAETTIMLKADLSCGSFEVIDAPAGTQQRDEVAVIAEAIAAQPGMSQAQVIKRVGIGRTKGNALLKSHEGRSWQTQRGPRGSLLYFPITCTEYRPVPGTSGTPEPTCTAVPAPLGAVQSTARNTEPVGESSIFERAARPGK